MHGFKSLVSDSPSPLRPERPLASDDRPHSVRAKGRGVSGIGLVP